MPPVQPPSVGEAASSRRPRLGAPSNEPKSPRVSSVMMRREPSCLQATRTRWPAPLPKAWSKARADLVLREMLADALGEEVAHAGGVEGGEQQDGGAEIGGGIAAEAGAVLGPLVPIELRAGAGHHFGEHGGGRGIELDRRQLGPAAILVALLLLFRYAAILALGPEAVEGEMVGVEAVGGERLALGFLRRGLAEGRLPAGGEDQELLVLAGGFDCDGFRDGGRRRSRPWLQPEYQRAAREERQHQDDEEPRAHPVSAASRSRRARRASRARTARPAAPWPGSRRRS